jgi:hypothetical protein
MTRTAEAIAPTEATLTALVNPEDKTTYYHFEWGPTEAYGHTTKAIASAPSLTSKLVKVKISKLQTETTYHYRIVAENETGSTHGYDQTVTTHSAEPPYVLTESASEIEETSATINGTVNPKGLATKYHFEWGLTSTYSSKTLDHISRWAANQCIAVGTTLTDYDNEFATVSERWNGTSWSYQGVLAPAEEEKYVEAGWKEVAAARSLPCTAENACMAVGWETITKAGEGGPTISRAEHWNGQEWVLEHPPGAADLQSVSCAAQSDCTAIGPAGEYGETNMIVAWNGSTWTEQRTCGANATDKLERLACPSTNACVAAGGDIAVHWNGSSGANRNRCRSHGKPTKRLMSWGWTVQARRAASVGEIRGTSEQAWTLLYRWNGTKWIKQEPIKGGGVKYREGYIAEETDLSGVSCWIEGSSEDKCIAVGSDRNGEYSVEPMAAKFE